MLRIGFATAPVLALAGCGGRSADGSTPAAPLLKLAYNVLVDRQADDHEVFVMSLDGSGRRNLSIWKGVDGVYCARGDKVYLTSDRDSTHRKHHLYEMNAEVRQERRISRFILEDFRLSSRHEGSQFVPTSKWEGPKAIHITDRKGEVISRAFTADFRFNDRCFSPDGSRIVFRSYESGVDELWVMNADGSDVRRLATDTALEQAPVFVWGRSES